MVTYTRRRTAARPRPLPRGGLVAAAVVVALTAGGGVAVTQLTAVAAPPDALVGWAARNGGTTGGGSGPTVEVSTAAAFRSAIASSGAQTVRLTADITLSGMSKVASDKTIVGAGAGKRITGGGLNLSGVRNVVIRNLVFDGWDDDAINVQSGTTNVWIDHNTFGKGYDGVVDIKRGSDFVTVSWNKVTGHDKTMLLGHSDGNGSQDTGHLRVTYHHNWFDGSTQRHPRVRFANPVHVFNNYYSNNGGYGVASTMNAGVLVEGNYFENVKDPFHRGEGSSGPGSLVARNNHFVNSGAGDAGGSVAPIPYAYGLDPAASVKALVTAGAGAGRISAAAPVTTPNPGTATTAAPTATGQTTSTTTATTSTKTATTTTKTATTTTKPVTTPSTASGTATKPSGGSTALVGWAARNGGTTGGGSGPTVEVSTAAAFRSAIASSGAQTVRLTADITLSGMSKVASDKTIVGAGAGKRITGGGLNLSGVRNVVIRNLVFDGWDDDAINVQSGTTNVWIDHNTFGKGYDGVVDIKRGSDFVTVSWNKVTGHDKTMLLGHSDGNGSQDTGHLRVTYHHNWFDGSTQRHPRVRFANPVHVFNNYYSNNGGYGVASTMNAGVLVEGNYFENVKDPFHRGEGSSGPGSLVARNNHFVNSGAGDAGGSVAPIPYPYTLDAASTVKSVVTAGAGAGRLSL